LKVGAGARAETNSFGSVTLVRILADAIEKKKNYGKGEERKRLYWIINIKKEKSHRKIGVQRVCKMGKYKGK
jgi:hypothetical protein